MAIESERGASWGRGNTSKGSQDRNPNHPYLSEEILSQPFEDRSLVLKAGIHLQWALRDTLTRTMKLSIVRRQAFTSVFGQKKWR